MLHSKLTALLRTFSGRQLARFREFLASPYFNKTSDLLSLFEYLAPFAPDFADAALEKRVVCKQVKTEKPLTDKRLAYLMNLMVQHAETFLAVEQFRSHELEEAMTLLGAQGPALLPKHSQAVLEKAARSLDLYPYRNSDYFLQAFRWSALQYARADFQQHQFQPALQQASDALDTFYIVEKLRYCWAMANMEYMLNLQYDWKLGLWLLDALDKSEQPPDPTVQVYLAGIRMVRESDDSAHFHRLRALLEQYGHRFRDDERKALYTGLLNYCTRRINRQNDQVFSIAYLEINQVLLAEGLLFDEGRLSPWRFLNLINTALRTGQPDWATDFIHRYRDRLPEEYADDINLVAMGQVHYHHRAYAQAQVLLNQANPRDVLLVITVRNLLVRIYYETGETELLLSFLEAYRMYLLRQGLLSPQMKQQARRFVDFTRRLAKIERHEAPLLPKLLNELPDAAEMYHRDWLVQQIEGKMHAFSR